MESVFKRYFPVIIKPITLVLLLFVAVSFSFVIFQVLSPVDPTSTIIDPGFTPEVTRSLLELYGLQEPLHIRYLKYIRNMFTWQFGYSFRTRAPVAEEMLWRLPNTLLLIGLSTLFYALIATGPSMLFKPRKRRPSTFAHSLRGLFLSPVVFISLLSIFFLAYWAYITLGFQIFPTRGMYSMPPPTDPFAYMVDVAWHLALPVTALVLVNVIRFFFVVWSSGSPFTPNVTLKRLLLPITTIDFTFTISAVIFVEWIFSLPGVGPWFLNGLMAADYPVVMALIVVFVEIAVGLGFVSTLFDFIQRWVGLRDDLDRKVAVESKISPSQTDINKNPVKQVLTRKSVVIGSAIIIAFLALAIFAPFITPYDPVASKRVADDFAMPAWMTIFPQFGDYPTTRDYMLYWNVEEGSEFIESWGENVVVEYEAKTMETVDVELSSNFSYTEIPPNSFYFKFEWNASDVVFTEYSLRITLFTPEGTSYLLWIQQGLKTERSEQVYIDSRDPFFRGRLDFGMEENPAPIIFSQPGEYSLLLRIRFRPETDTARCQINLENAEFVIPGRVHGVLGCDYMGSDIFTQLVYGARTALILVSLTAFLAVILGFQFGFLAGYRQGWADNILTPIFDMVLCLPILPILLPIIFLYGKNVYYISLISVLFLFALAAMAFRNTFLVRPSNQKFKGKTAGEKVLNVFKDLVSNFCLTGISLMLLLPIIDFLGFGDPRVTSWGKMLQYSFAFGAFTRLAWWWIFPPAVCIALFALGLFLIGTGLEDESS